MELKVGTRFRDTAGRDYKVMEVGADKYNRVSMYPSFYVLRRGDGVVIVWFARSRPCISKGGRWR